MKKGLTLAGLLMVSPWVWAQVQGVVVDPQGAVISSAVIDVVGANLQFSTNEKGEFSLPKLGDHHVELHIKAPRFMHKTLHLHSQPAEPLRLVLYPSTIDVINVTALPWHVSNMESAQPVNVLEAENLRKRQSVTLGDTLKYEVGIHSSYYGPVSSSPIIRGLEGPRVLIAQNGLDAGDASRVGPDHAVATEAATARQIEVLRGPATLFFGSGAIGGVVNVVDDRVPSSSDLRGEWRLQHADVANDKLASASVTSGGEEFALHVDGFWRDSGDYRLPGGGHGRLDNSATEAQGYNLGGSYLMSQGYLGLSVGRLERQYGIPGHRHGDHEDHDHELDVHAELTQDRVQLISELTLDNDFFSALNTRIGYTDYEHFEIENGEQLTRFYNLTREARFDLFHHPLAEWSGALSLHAKQSDFVADGVEAFTPPSMTESFALALVEERHLGDWLLQLGARVEQVSLTSDTLDLVLHQDEPLHEISQASSIKENFTPVSASVGVVWDFTEGYNLGLSLTHAQRAPSAAEVFAFGPHLGSGLFEVGALMTVEFDEQHGHLHFERLNSNLALEKSNNIDLSLRHYADNLGFIFNAFYNRIDDYYSLRNTGLIYSGGDHQHEDHEHHDEGEDQDHGELPVYVYEAQDVRLYGFEGQVGWQVSERLKLTFMGDSIRARSVDGNNLPRIPPLRLGSQLNYDWGRLSLELGVQRYFKQDRLAAYETPTSAYTLVDMQISYGLDDLVPGMQIYLQGKNLTDREARVHSSFLKEQVPLPGRSLVVGLSGRF